MTTRTKAKIDPNDGVRALPSGRWSIPCERCGKRHTQRFSDDNVWCASCRDECAATGHVPDDDDPTCCFKCGQSNLPNPPEPDLEATLLSLGWRWLPETGKVICVGCGKEMGSCPHKSVLV